MPTAAAGEPDEPPPPPHPANRKAQIVTHSNAAARFSRAVDCGAGNGKAFSNSCADLFKLKVGLAIDYIIQRSI
jgi:hypothetical protein